MTATTAEDRSIVRISRVNATYLVPFDHPTPASVRAKLDDLVRRDVAAACARRFGPLCDDADPSVWFVRRLVVDVSVDAAWEAPRLGDACAAEVTRSLHRRLCNGDDGEEVLRFPNRAVWLAQFLRDLADGVAWSKWYYESLDGLRALPLSAALREAICREPLTGEAALRQLADDLRLGTILGAMSDGDCRTVWRVFREQDAGTEAVSLNADHLHTVARAWQHARTLESNYRAALHLFFMLPNADVRNQAKPALRQAIEALLALVRRTRSASGDHFVRALERGEFSTAMSSVGSLGVESLANLLARDRAAVLEVARELRSRAPAQNSTAPISDSETAFTPFGGIFFLLPHFAELGLDECAAVLPEFGGGPALALARFLVMLKCLGGAYAPRAFFDPLLREVAGVAPTFEAEDVRAWARSVTCAQLKDFRNRWTAREARANGDEHIGATADNLRFLSLAVVLRGARQLDRALSLVAQEVLRSFAWRLPGFARSSCRYLFTNFLDVRAQIDSGVDGWQVRLARPPLHIVLAMTGAAQNSFPLPWLDNRRVQITTSEL